MDLYSKQIGSNFSDIDSFSAYIGGSPTNISVCSQRLGLKTALLSAVGDDLTGKFIMEKVPVYHIVDDKKDKKAS